MKKVPVIVILVFVLISSLSFADKPLGPVEMTSIDELAYTIASYFPKVHGEVTVVNGDRLTVSLGEKNGLLPGMVLTVWRDGSNILHPVTGAVIGRTEDEVGTIEVVSVKETVSEAGMKKQVKEPKAGDRARITPKKINIGILPLQSERPEIIQGLTERLGELGRFTVLGNDKVSAFLKDRKQRDASLVKDMGTAFSLVGDQPQVQIAFGGFHLLFEKGINAEGAVTSFSDESGIRRVGHRPDEVGGIIDEAAQLRQYILLAGYVEQG